MDVDKAKPSDATDTTDESWVRGLLLPAYFLVLLVIGTWLLSGGSAPDVAIGAYALVLVASIAGLFFRKQIFIAFDRRNYIDLSRSQWFGRRDRSRTDNGR